MNESKKVDAVFIDDIPGEIRNIRQFVGGMKKEDFIKNEMAKRAVERSIQIIGEAAKNLSVSFREKHADIEWRKIIAMRNLITHAYSSVDYNMVWEAAMRDCFALEKKLLQIDVQTKD